VPRVSRDPAERGGQRVDIANGKDLPDAADEIRAAANRVADHGDQSAGHALVDDEAPGLAPARQGQDVTAGVPAGQRCLVDEAQAANGQAGLVPAHLGAERPVAEYQQVQLRAGAGDGQDQVEWPLLRDQLAGEDDRRARRVEA
jgi:hypothetical protein